MSVEVKPEHARMLNNTKNVTLGIAIVSTIQAVLSAVSIVGLLRYNKEKKYLLMHMPLRSFKIRL